MDEQQKWVSINNGEYLHIPKFISKIEGNMHLKALLTDIEWKQDYKSMYGNETNSPRLSAIYGDSDKPYSYNKEMVTPYPWTDTLLPIKQKIQSLVETEFNSVILNQFRNEDDSLSWHSDAGNDLGQNPTIVYITLGATRKFQFRHREKNGRIDLHLTHGSILITTGEMQHHWVHQVPKSKKKTSQCINLIFRTIK